MERWQKRRIRQLKLIILSIYILLIVIYYYENGNKKYEGQYKENKYDG